MGKESPAETVTSQHLANAPLELVPPTMKAWRNSSVRTRTSKLYLTSEIVKEYASTEQDHEPKPVNRKKPNLLQMFKNRTTKGKIRIPLELFCSAGCM
jgi:hypothetical protein